MPSALLQPFAEFCIASQRRFTKVALVTDVRAHESFEQLFRALDSLRARSTARSASCFSKRRRARSSAATRKRAAATRSRSRAKRCRPRCGGDRTHAAGARPCRLHYKYAESHARAAAQSSAVCSPRPARLSCRSTWSPSATNTASPSMPISCWTFVFCRTLIYRGAEGSLRRRPAGVRLCHAAAGHSRIHAPAHGVYRFSAPPRFREEGSGAHRGRRLHRRAAPEHFRGARAHGSSARVRAERAARLPRSCEGKRTMKKRISRRPDMKIAAIGGGTGLFHHAARPEAHFHRPSPPSSP